MADNEFKISIKVLPNAGRNSVAGLANGIWRFKIAAPPDKGKANKELVEFLAEILELKKDQVQVVRGHTNHNKLISVTGLTCEEIYKRLAKIAE